MVKSLYPQPIMITTVDPVPADSRFYAVNERIHRFPILKPNALTEVGPSITCSHATSSNYGLHYYSWLCKSGMHYYANCDLDPLLIFHETTLKLCSYITRYDSSLSSLQLSCLTPCWAIVIMCTLVSVEVAHGTPSPLGRSKETLEWI